MVSNAATVQVEESARRATDQRLPRRDYVILPLLSVLTILIMFGTAEIVARAIWADVQTDPCLMHTKSSGDRYKPNCTSRTKLAEGPWTTNVYNECGYRSTASCGPKPSGTIRIAVLGSSAADGFMVPYEQTFAGIVERNLTRECGRPVQIQNLGVTGVRLLEEAHRMDEALALQPDMVMLVLTPNDIWQNISPQQWEDRQQPSSRLPEDDENQGLRAQSPLERIRDRIQSGMILSRTLLVMRHYLYRNDQLYLKIYLSTHGDEGDYLRVPYTKLWRNRMDDLNVILGGMASMADLQHTPFAVAPSLVRVQAGLLTSRNEFPEIDPYAFEQEVAQIAGKHGIADFDSNGDFGRVAHSADLFYLVNGHTNDKGQAILAGSITRQILASHILRACNVASGPSSN